MSIASFHHPVAHLAAARRRYFPMIFSAQLLRTPRLTPAARYSWEKLESPPREFPSGARRVGGFQKQLEGQWEATAALALYSPVGKGHPTGMTVPG